MIPRTVLMAQEVSATLTAPQEQAYGNIILNGYQSSVPNTVNKKAWQYAETLTPPVDLPSLVETQPVLKGWTNNYQEYYTQLQPNAYGVNPGDPTMFEYNVHSFTQATGVITALGVRQSGINYTPGLYTNVATFGGSGTGATLNLTVDSNGIVTVATLNNPGTGYTTGDGLGTLAIGPGQGFAVAVATTTTVTTPNRSKWAQPPHRLINNAVAPQNPPAYNSQANPYSAVLYPVADREDAPPIDSLG